MVFYSFSATIKCILPLKNAALITREVHNMHTVPLLIVPSLSEQAPFLYTRGPSKVPSSGYMKPYGFSSFAGSTYKIGLVFILQGKVVPPIISKLPAGKHLFYILPSPLYHPILYKINRTILILWVENAYKQNESNHSIRHPDK